MRVRDITNEAPAVPANAVATAGKAAGVLGKAGKFLGKAIPGVGLAAGAYDVYARQKAGDTTGAAISGAATAASQIPVIGTAAGLGLAGIQAVRDKFRTGSWIPDEEEVATAVAKDAGQTPAAQVAKAPATPVPPGGDPKVFALQQKLIAKGAKIKADGKMGPATQTAMKQFPDVQMASKENKGNIMTEAERIAALRDRLSQIETTQVNEGPLDALKAAGGAIATGAKNFGRGLAGQGARTATGQFAKAGAANKAGQAIGKAGQAVKNQAGNIAKVGAGAVAGAAGMAALQGAGTKPAAPATPGKTGAGTKPAAAPAAAPAAGAGAPDPKEVDELNQLAASLENSQDPEDIALLQQYNGVINAINNRGAGDKRTQDQIAASADLNAAGV